MKRLAVALATVLAAGCSSSAPPAAGPPAARLVASTPSGAVAWPLEFKWTGASASDVVHVHVADDAERPLEMFETRGDHLRAPEKLKSLLRPGTRYQWRVARLDANGQEADGSAPTVFEITGSDAVKLNSP